MRVPSSNRPPTFESVRETERLVAAANLAEPTLPPDEPPLGETIGSGQAPQAASVALAEGEARQAQVLSEMKRNSETIYRNTLSAIN